ncbi:conserved exported hypothetical protein [Pseudoalteromonas sp. 3J6]|jgi:hypothetical protein|uniref:hypothetical protein n=1 Tax=unclassified Pseudoalteromonas TaxID=194690 RepID=UPI00148691C5|nr:MULTISPECIES: hypothetical protein [unclassified Pseudoalteromonas]MDN3486915.1 hypothetical protein [Pseudoalteromonas sp. APC 3224]CAD2224620.1 conserved exported hypothetical protein [Pseudoalteromonas sp. 3J6]
MNIFIKWLILAALIIAAITCYSYGSTTGLFIFIIAGFVFEMAFMVFPIKKKSSL